MSKQEDTILRFPKLCGVEERATCSSPLSVMKRALEREDDTGTMNVTDTPLCSEIVPVGCPRVLCKDDAGHYSSCRMSLLVEGQLNESGYWMRLPCGTCTEEKELHPTTRGYQYDG